MGRRTRSKLSDMGGSGVTVGPELDVVMVGSHLELEVLWRKSKVRVLRRQLSEPFVPLPQFRVPPRNLQPIPQLNKV